ncbi:unnamed protein product, partial [Amoebophrya sp. A25]|eukprot:GSA25T00021699001.1
MGCRLPALVQNGRAWWRHTHQNITAPSRPSSAVLHRSISSAGIERPAGEQLKRKGKTPESSLSQSCTGRARILAQRIRSSLQRDSEFLSVAALRSGDFLHFQEQARALLAERHGPSTEEDLELVDLYYWLCKSLVGSAGSLDDDVLLGFSRVLQALARELVPAELRSIRGEGYGGRETKKAFLLADGACRMKTLDGKPTILRPKLVSQLLRCFILTHNQKQLEMRLPVAVEVEGIAQEVFENVGLWIR